MPAPARSAHLKVLSPTEARFGELPEQVSLLPVAVGPEFAAERVISDDDSGLFAIWEAQPGTLPRVKDARGSSMYIFSGDATVHDTGGTAHELREGSVLVLPYRWEGRWEIRRTIRKVYAHTWPTGEPAIVPATGTHLSGLDISESRLDAPLPAATHRGGLPDARGRIVGDGVDGLCAVVALDARAHPTSAGTRTVFAYVIEGDAELESDAGPGARLSAGSAAVIPAGWSGCWRVGRPLRLFAVFAQPR